MPHNRYMSRQENMMNFMPFYREDTVDRSPFTVFLREGCLRKFRFFPSIPKTATAIVKRPSPCLTLPMVLYLGMIHTISNYPSKTVCLTGAGCSSTETIRQGSQGLI